VIPRRIFITHGTHFEKWDVRTPDERGIGQSETANIELAWRMAARGWDVTCYAPIPDDAPREWRGTHWRTMEEIDYSQQGYWIIFRQPELLDNFHGWQTDQYLSLCSQDEDYPGRWNEARVAKLDTLFALCEAHKRSLEADHPGLKGKVKVAANGIKMELIRDAEEEFALTNSAVDEGTFPPQMRVSRDPHRIMWASSPDRGLLRLLKIFKRLREWIPDASLYIAYGFNNIEKLVAMGPQFQWMQKAKDEIMNEAEQPGVHWLGRIPQPQLMREWLKTGIICYPTLFRETYCSSHCEAMALGAIPVCSPVWALGEHALAGSLIPGDPADPLIQSRFVSEIYRWMTQTDQANFIRSFMMQEARLHYSWERAIDKYEAALLGFDDHRLNHSQFNFQLKHALPYKGSILNVGCADDPADLRSIGAVNLDSRIEDPIFHVKTKADIIADVRDLPDKLGHQRFQCVVCGDALEHFPIDQVPGILRNLKACLAPGGKLVLTIPDDHREVGAQHSKSDGSHEYSNGVSAVHTHPIPRPILDGWLKEAGLVVETYQEIDCFFYKNHGVVCRDRDGMEDSHVRHPEHFMERIFAERAKGDV
jgi:glycosyltransferase involved in cell wall biosynthesis